MAKNNSKKNREKQERKELKSDIKAYKSGSRDIRFVKRKQKRAEKSGVREKAKSGTPTTGEIKLRSGKGRSTDKKEVTKSKSITFRPAPERPKGKEYKPGEKTLGESRETKVIRFKDPYKETTYLDGGTGKTQKVGDKYKGDLGKGEVVSNTKEQLSKGKDTGMTVQDKKATPSESKRNARLRSKARKAKNQYLAGQAGGVERESKGETKTFGGSPYVHKHKSKEKKATRLRRGISKDREVYKYRTRQAAKENLEEVTKKREELGREAPKRRGRKIILSSGRTRTGSRKKRKTGYNPFR